MKPFHFWRDPVCLAAFLLYALNRWLLKPNFNSVFLHSHFNDVLLIPAALPVLLWMQRKLGLRKNDGFPTVSEIAGHVVVWSILFEVIGPHVMRTVADPLDVAAYCVGALAAWLFWSRRASQRVCGLA